MNGRPAAVSPPMIKRVGSGSISSSTTSSMAKVKPQPLKLPSAPATTLKNDIKKQPMHSTAQKVVVVPSRYLTTKRTEDKAEEPKAVVVKKAPAPPPTKEKLHATTTATTSSRLARPKSSPVVVPSPRPSTIKKSTTTLNPKPVRPASNPRKPPKAVEKGSNDESKEEKAESSDSLQDGSSASPVVRRVDAGGNRVNEQVIGDLHGRIKELQGALAALTFERDSLQQQLHSTEHSSGDTGDADEDFDGGSVGSMESWDSEMTDERDDKYNELLKRYHSTLTLLKQRIGIFKTALGEAKTEYDSLYAKHTTLLAQNEAMHQELELLRNLNNKSKLPNPSVAVLS